REALMMVSTIVAGLIAISASSGAIYFPAFQSFSVPMALSFASAHIVSGQESMVLIGLLMLCFLAVSYYFALRGQQQFRELIRARFDNSELMRKLESEKLVAERAVIAKNRFLASASHDLRQPLHALRLFIGTLRNRERDPGQLQIIDDMEKSADALTSLFNSLLDMSRLDAETIEFSPEHLCVGEIFDRLRAQFGAQAKDKGLALGFEDNDLVCYSDPVLLERVLRNLVVNALQYTEKGEVRVSCEAGEGEMLLMSVTDTGIGIPEEFRDEVFNEFVQLGNEERDRDKGLGLGLSIVSKLCGLMGVELVMNSDVNTGTTFRMLLPRGESALTRTAQASARPLSVSGFRVMVIDDEAQVRQSMRYLLEEWGCDVQLAESARDALKIVALSNSWPSLIISDYRLRGKQRGIDAVFAIREAADTPIPAVIITGDTSPERLREVKRSGLELLHKPIDVAALRALLVNHRAEPHGQRKARADTRETLAAEAG
ncbi:MAG: hybrid sensor histidine kinase/response regulator, partial [Gammaproteobacteria bacterium]